MKSYSTMRAEQKSFLKAFDTQPKIEVVPKVMKEKPKQVSPQELKNSFREV